VFSQYTSVLGVLKTLMKKRGIEPLYLDGKTPEKTRRALVTKFQEGSTKFFLISLKAGGTALTLTRADTVIHLDPWWNPAAENQATDRAHRIGQKKHVMVYKLISEGSVEEKVLTLQGRKRELFNELIDGEEASSSRITRDDIAALLGDA
jgi:SNF2 family DNA or RNA helicase